MISSPICFTSPELSSLHYILFELLILGLFYIVEIAKLTFFTLLLYCIVSYVYYCQGLHNKKNKCLLVKWAVGAIWLLVGGGNNLIRSVCKVPPSYSICFTYVLVFIRLNRLSIIVTNSYFTLGLFNNYITPVH